MENTKTTENLIKNEKKLQISCNNLGIYYENDQFSFCYIDLIGNKISYAYSISEKKELPTENITPINYLFIKRSKLASCPFGKTISYLEENTDCEIFDKLKSNLSMVCLFKLSKYEQDFIWYKNQPIWTIKENKEKSFSINHLKKEERKLNKIEHSVRLKMENVKS